MGLSKRYLLTSTFTRLSKTHRRHLIVAVMMKIKVPNWLNRARKMTMRAKKIRP